VNERGGKTKDTQRKERWEKLKYNNKKKEEFFERILMQK